MNPKTSLLFILLFTPSLAAQENSEFSAIETIAGNGKSTIPSGGSALKTSISNPFGIHPTPNGEMVIVSYDKHVLFALDSAGNKLRVVAGTGKKGINGANGSPATSVEMNGPHEIQVDAIGNIYVADTFNHRVGKIDHKTGTWETIVGTGKKGFSGDGGPASRATFNQAYSIALDDQTLFVADLQNQRIREVNLKTGIIRTICGNGQRKRPADGAAALGQPLAGPRSLAVDKDNLWIVLREGNSIWRIDRKTNRIHHVAGTGKKGFSGDGGSAKAAQFSGPKGIAVDPGKAIFIADTENNAIRKVDLLSGIITTVAGATGKKGYDGDGDNPQNRKLARPHGVFLTAKGDLLIGDSENHRVRKLTRSSN